VEDYNQKQKEQKEENNTKNQSTNKIE